MQYHLYLRGRNIDGTVYWAGDGWVSSIVSALELRDMDAAEKALVFVQAQYPKSVSPDDAIGKIAIVAKTSDYIKYAYNLAMSEALDEDMDQ